MTARTLAWLLAHSDQSASGCWLWKNDRTARYPQVKVLGNRTKRTLVHRLAYRITYGEIPDGLCVCHRCDNPRCVNPAHLFVGSTSENQFDSVSKGRHYEASR